MRMRRIGRIRFSCTLIDFGSSMDVHRCGRFYVVARSYTYLGFWRIRIAYATMQGNLQRELS